MKKLAFLTIPLLAAIFTANGVSANAAVGGTIYPEDEEFTKTLALTSLNDYAVEDGIYAFADGKAVKVFNGGSYAEYAFENDVTSVDIRDGEIYCGCTDGKAYTLSDQTECEYSFPQKTSEVLYSGYYYFTDDGGLNIFNKSTKENTTYEGDYSNLKLYGETVYAAYGNALYTFTGAQREEVVLEYDVDKSDVKIPVGQAASALKKYIPLQFVEIDGGAFMTAIDLEKLDGEYFVPLNIVRAEENTVAALLCYSGNAAIVSIKDTAYAVLKSKVNEGITIDCTTEKPFDNAQMIGGNIYASPYVVSGTVASSNATGITVKVINRLDCESILGCVFYEVEYEANGESVKGYVAEGFLSKVIIEDEKKPVEKPDPEYSESSDTKTILIIFAVVLLVLAAIGYISYISAKGKSKGKNKKDKNGEN